MMQTKHPQWKTLPQGHLHHLCGRSFSGIKQLMAIPQQYWPPHRGGLGWRGRSYLWLFAMRDKTPSSPESLRLSNSLSRILPLRMAPGSQHTDAAVRWRQRFSSRRSNVAYSTSFARCPLPR